MANADSLSRTPHQGLSLLATKLSAPRPQHDLVLRPQLLACLNAGLTHTFTLVAAPAGCGKSTLVAGWVHRLSLPVAWLSLDAADNDAARCTCYLAAAVQPIEPAAGADVIHLQEEAQPAPLETAVAALVNDLARLAHHFLLILDDFHLIDDAASQGAVRRLVLHQPSQLHLVIVTRKDPPLPLARLWAHGQLVELRAQDLRFSAQETAQFLRQVMGSNLDPAAIEKERSA